MTAALSDSLNYPFSWKSRLFCQAKRRDRERQRQRDREAETESDRDRETDRKTDRQTDRQTKTERGFTCETPSNIHNNYKATNKNWRGGLSALY